jgi:polysaccharide pyruvyl transferase WcaK-like protein
MSAIRVGSCSPSRIGIVGYYGVGNLGDETVVAILMKKISEYYPNAEFCGFSLNAADTARRHGIKAFPIRRGAELSLRHASQHVSRDTRKHALGKLKDCVKRLPVLFAVLKRLKQWVVDLPWEVLEELAFLGRSFKRLQGIDLLVVPGSGPLTDWWGGPWMHPYSQLSWAFLAKMTRTRYIALSIGCERLNTWLGKRFCRWFLSMVHYRSFRDRFSRDAMKAIGLKGDAPVFPDQGFALPDLVGPSPVWMSKRPCQEPRSGLIIGVSPVGHDSCVAENGNDAFYQRYVHTLSSFVLWLVQRGYRIAFCPTDCVQDPPLVEQITTKVRAALPHVDLAGRILHSGIATTEDLIARMQMCDIVVASRFHAVVFPFALQKPVLALSYGRKMRDLMAACGQAAYHQELDKAEVGDMIRVFQALEHRRHSIAQHLGAVVSNYRSRVDDQYRAVCGGGKQASGILRRAG